VLPDHGNTAESKQGWPVLTEEVREKAWGDRMTEPTAHDMFTSKSIKRLVQGLTPEKVDELFWKTTP
jgi:hypothetical protein